MTSEELIELGEKRLGAVYAERNMLVAALTKVWPSYLALHPDDSSWDPEWRTTVFVMSPAGQLSWHIHDSEKYLFDHLELRENDWDGHTTPEKYVRLDSIKPAWEVHPSSTKVYKLQ